MPALFVQDHHATSCASAFERALWPEASALCGRESADGDSSKGVRHARALFYAGRYEESLAVANRWFGTKDGATARLIAGSSYLQRGNLAMARPLLERARDEHLARGDHAEVARDAQQLTGVLMFAGAFAEALDTAELGAREADRTTDARLQGSARLALGTLLDEIGDYERAREELWRARDRLAPWPPDHAWITLQLGMLARGRGDEAAGVMFLGNALDLATTHGVTRVEVAARLNLARAERELGHLDAADGHLSALPPESRLRSTAMFVAALVTADRGERATADRLFELAAANLPTDDYALDVAVQRGRIAERADDSAGAERFYRDAISIVEKLRKDTGALELRPWVLAKRREPYAALLDVLARANRRAEALEIAERLHARTWLDALIDRPGARDARTRAASAPSLERRLRTDTAGAPLVAADLLSIMGRRDALVFAEVDAATWRFHVVDGAIARLDRLPDDLRSLVAGWQVADAELAQRLGDLLVPPAARIQSARPLYVVADGVLRGLPFAALRPDGRLLVESRSVVRLPGLIALRCRAVAPEAGGAVFIGDSRPADPLPPSAPQSS